MDFKFASVHSSFGVRRFATLAYIGQLVCVQRTNIWADNSGGVKSPNYKCLSADVCRLIYSLFPSFCVDRDRGDPMSTLHAVE